MPTVVLPALHLESGVCLEQVQACFQTWGHLSPRGDNAVLLCHTLTSNADASAWWGPLLGPGKLLDTTRLFVVCINNLGSPYGTASPLTVDPRTSRPYGPDFPAVTIRDQVRFQRRVLERLGLSRLALVLGPSMGGMMALEWAFEGRFARALAPIAAGPAHSAWGIAWSAVQRWAITQDPDWRGGRYPPDAQPIGGLSLARRIAMLSYRTPGQYQDRFGRQRSPVKPFSVCEYLSHQGEKFVNRFDANCYVHLTRQLNTHDLSRERGPLPETLASIRQPTCVVGVNSDLLYPPDELEQMAGAIPGSELVFLDSPYGHDAFFIEFDALENALSPFIDREVYARLASGHIVSTAHV